MQSSERRSLEVKEIEESCYHLFHCVELLHCHHFEECFPRFFGGHRKTVLGADCVFRDGAGYLSQAQLLIFNILIIFKYFPSPQLADLQNVFTAFETQKAPYIESTGSGR